MPRNKKTQADKDKKDQAAAALEAGQSSQADPADTAVEQDDRPGFPIVGIGASAGGLEAAEGFFKAMPSDSGFAFVLVQHLDPTHQSILAELVQRWTGMVVDVVEDGMRVEPNSIYVIPPNRDMALSEGRLRLIEPTASRGLRLPIDFFFRSMAADLQERAICIILSGTGTDGSLGLKEIRGVGGMAMAQDPETAKYDGMPRSAIATGLVDYILPPHEMPERLIAYADGYYIPGGRQGSQAQPIETDALAKIFLLLQHQKKHDFAQYKRNTIDRRIMRRMAVNHFERLWDYLHYLQNNPREVEILFRELLIGVTSFFRDPQAFDMLEKRAIPQILDSLKPSEAVRVWVPGCSTGEEAYSIAMMIREQMSLRKQEHLVQIFATDIDEQAIKRARVGLYPNNIAADVSPERRSEE